MRFLLYMLLGLFLYPAIRAVEYLGQGLEWVFRCRLRRLDKTRVKMIAVLEGMPMGLDDAAVTLIQEMGPYCKELMQEIIDDPKEQRWAVGMRWLMDACFPPSSRDKPRGL